MNKKYIKLWYTEFFWLSFISLALLIQTSIMASILIFNEPFFVHMTKIAILLEPINFGVSGIYQNLHLSSYLLDAINNSHKPFVLIILFLSMIGSASLLMFPFIKTVFKKR